MAKRPSDTNTAEKYDKTKMAKRPSDKNTAEKYDKTNEWQNDRVTKILLGSMTKQVNGKTTE